MPWDVDNESQGGQGEKLPTGQHDVTISKVIVSKENGQQWRTKKGDRQIMVVYEDARGAEATQFYPVEGAARWRLSKLVHALGLRTADLNDAGLEAEHLLVQVIADRWLTGKRLTIDVVLKENGYHDVDALGPPSADGPDGFATSPTRAGQNIGKTPPDDDDVPF